jgi:WS/DGAT/MGAT family acyltransferase
VSSRRLSTLDASFLYMETPEAPLNIGAVQVFDGPLSREAFVQRLRWCLDGLPRYRQRVVDAPLGLGLPFWEDDPAFDVSSHVLEIRLPPPGDTAQLRAAVAGLLELPLARSRPLWELHVVNGLEGNRAALVTRIHHAMVDGVSGVAMMEALLDTGPEPATPAARRFVMPAPVAAPVAEPDGALARGVEVARDAGLQLAEAVRAGLQTLARAAAAPAESLARVSELSGELAYAATQPVERLPFNRPLTGRRRFSWVEWPVAAIRDVRAAAGGVTLNDVVLAAVGDAVGRMLREADPDAAHRVFRAMVPVNVRERGERGSGNRVSIVPVEVALDAAALDRVRQVAARTRRLKSGRVAERVDDLISAAGLLPSPLVSLAIGLAANPTLQSATAALRSSPWLTANAVCTNVPGPPMPLYAQGRRLVAHYPVVPLAFEFGLSFAIFSYDQRVFVGVIADAGAIDDLAPLTQHLDEAFAALVAAAGAADEAPAGVVRPRRATPQRRRRSPGARR